MVVDSGVWIDFFNGVARPEQITLQRLLTDAEATLVVPDLVLYEVLRGFRSERDYLQAERLMQSMSVEAACSPALAQRAAQHDRQLRAVGVTVCSAVDVLVATFCIERGYTLLHRDRDFEAFEDLRGLRVWRH